VTRRAAGARLRRAGEEELIASTATSGFAPVEGTELAYVIVGEGSPIVAVHGGPAFGHEHLRPGFDRLATGRRVIYYDQRGSGRSELGAPDRANVAGTLADLDQLLAHLEIDRATLIGHSLAAWIAALYAATRPERVRALVLLNIGPPIVPELRERFSNEMTTRRSREDVAEMERIEASPEYARRDAKTLERHYQLRFTPFFRNHDAALSANYGFSDLTAQNVLEAGGRLMSDFAAHDPAGSLGRISCPTLVVHSELDPIPRESSEFVANRIPGATLVELKNASHFAFLEDTDAFVDAVEPFLRKHAGS
jgi:proline iminopeptidase